MGYLYRFFLVAAEQPAGPVSASAERHRQHTAPHRRSQRQAHHRDEGIGLHYMH